MLLELELELAPPLLEPPLLDVPPRLLVPPELLPPLPPDVPPVPPVREVLLPDEVPPVEEELSLPLVEAPALALLEPPWEEEDPAAALLLLLPGSLLPPVADWLELEPEMLEPPLPPVGLLEPEEDDDFVLSPLCEGGANAQPKRTLVARRARMGGERNFMRVLLRGLNPPGRWVGNGEGVQTLRNGTSFGKGPVRAARISFMGVGAIYGQAAARDGGAGNGRSRPRG